MVILEQKLFEMYTFGMPMQFERIVMAIFLPSKKSKITITKLFMAWLFRNNY